MTYAWPMARFEYPKTPEEAARTSFETAHRLYGSGAGGVDALFGRHLTTTAPWPKPARLKGEPVWDKPTLDAGFKNPVIGDVDPRYLHATQSDVTRPGVNYYMSDEYKRSGRTYADMDQGGNRRPVIYTDSRGQNKILSGHHRATAALINGTQFEAHLITEAGA